MKKLIITLFFFSSLNLCAQQGDYLKEANYFFEQKSFVEAANAFKVVLKTDPYNCLAHYRAGLSYFNLKDYPAALVEFNKTISMVEEKKEQKQNFALAWFYKGLTLKSLKQYEEAKTSFLQFLKIKSYQKDIRNFKKLANNQVRSCNFAIDQRSTQYYQNYIVRKLEGKANTAYSEFSPRFIDNETIVFSSLLNDSLLLKHPEDVQPPVVKLFETKLKNDESIKVQEFQDVNDDFFHTANGSFTPDKKTFYFTRCADDRNGNTRCFILQTENRGKTWTKPEKLKSKINLGGYTSTQPYFGAVRYANKSFDALYFVSDRPGGRGGLDIWFAEAVRGGKFKSPVNCGSAINSPGNEISPYYNSEERSIYFSSDYWWGLGGYDVFKAEGYRKSWRRPENLGQPVNSSYDDSYYYFDEKTGKGLLSSNRPQPGSPSAACCEDIFLVNKNPVREINAIVKDADSTNLILPEVRVGYSFENQNEPEEINWIMESDEKGEFTFVKELRNSYSIILEKPGYKTTSFHLDSILKNQPDSGAYVFYMKKLQHRNVEVKPVISTEKLLAQANRKIFSEKVEDKPAKKGDVFILADLHFEFNKSNLTEEFYKDLETLYHFLEMNPEIKIEISGHTDSRGSDDYNLELSQRRAEVVKQFLIEKGISEDRLSAIGYGEKMPLADNDTEEGQKLNRRTEVKIL